MALTGDWKDHRDRHIKPDRILIHRQPDDATGNSCALARTLNSACSHAFAETVQAGDAISSF